MEKPKKITAICLVNSLYLRSNLTRGFMSNKGCSRVSTTTVFILMEIESDIAGTYINFPNVKYPMLEVLADAYVKKSKGLLIR